jgi:hypothetical protein
MTDGRRISDILFLFHKNMVSCNSYSMLQHGALTTKETRLWPSGLPCNPCLLAPGSKSAQLNAWYSGSNGAHAVGCLQACSYNMQGAFPCACVQGLLQLKELNELGHTAKW